MASGIGDSAAWFLAITFVIAGVAKWKDPASTQESFRAFGLHGPEFLARAVPIFEFATAFGLVVAPRLVSLVALALIVGFTTVLIRGMRAGVTVGCSCFGSSRRQGVSGLDVVRNILLSSLALTSALLSETGIAKPSLSGVVGIGGGLAATSGLFALARARKADQTRAVISPEPHAKEGSL